MSASLSPDLVLRLGDFAFDDLEIPEKVNFGGSQKLAVHELVGGARIVDSMGGFEDPIEWTGLLRGPNAIDRAKKLDAMRSAGKALALRWGEFRYQVVIETFHADFERFYQIPYTIRCLPIQTVDPLIKRERISLDSAMRADVGNLSALSAALPPAVTAPSTLQSAIGAIKSAVSAVSSFATATTATINSVLAPIAAAQTQARNLIASVGNTVSSVASLGGIVPGNPIAQQAAKLTGQLTAMSSLPQLYNINSVLGRMATNLRTAGTSGQVLNTAGGNLYQVAATQYGDATAWTVVAKANKITDPQLAGLQSLNIPPAQGGSAPVGGVLSG